MNSLVGEESNVWSTDVKNNGNRRINRKFRSGKLNCFRRGGSVFSKNPKLGSYGSSKPNFRGPYRRNNMQNAFLPGRIKRSVKLAAAPIVCGSEPVMGALENPISNNHSSVGSSSDKRAFSNSGNLAQNVTKKNVQEFSHIVSNHCEPIVAPKSKMFKLQVSVTCQHECSQDCQPQYFPNENILFGVMKCLSQVITKFDNVFAGCQMYLCFLLKVKSFMRSLICSECRGIYVASSPETGAYVTDVTDGVSLPVTSSKIDSIHPFERDNFNVSVTIKGNSYRALLDTGAAVTAISSQVWDKYLSHKNCCLDSSSTSCVTTVSGSPLNVLGKVWLNFVIKSDVFPFEAYVIKDLTHDVVLGRDFLQKYCSRIEFMQEHH